MLSLISEFETKIFIVSYYKSKKKEVCAEKCKTVYFLKEETQVKLNQSSLHKIFPSTLYIHTGTASTPTERDSCDAIGSE